jgi:hypothetical protein
MTRLKGFVSEYGLANWLTPHDVHSVPVALDKPLSA